MIEKSVIVLLVTFIFCIPFPYTTSITNICFYLSLAAVLVLIVVKHIDFTFNTPLAFPLILFFIWAFLSIFWSVNKGNSLHDVRGHLVNHIILFFLLVNFFNSRKRLAILSWTVVISAAAFSLVGMFYYYVIMGNSIHATRFGFLLSNSVNWSTELPVNFIGTITVFSIILCLHLSYQEFRIYRHAAIIACMIPTLIATILTQSKGTFVALIIAIIIQLFIKAKKILLLFILAIAVILMLFPLQDRITAKSFKERLKINYFTYEVIKDYPLTGIGFGMQTFVNDIDKNLYMKRLPEKYRPAEVYTPHNLLLDITVRLGLTGLILFLFIIFSFGRICWETIKNARDKDIRSDAECMAVSFIAYFTIGLAEPVFLFRASAIVFYIILAIMTILWRLNRNEGLPRCSD
ncbi:MAG: O-antigen ligase family protein [Pseudomonadota bacterium]